MATPRKPAHDPQTVVPDRGDPAAVAHFIRDRLAALENAFQVFRLVAESDPRLADTLALAERQVTALALLADVLHDPAGTLPARTRRNVTRSCSA